MRLDKASKDTNKLAKQQKLAEELLQSDKYKFLQSDEYYKNEDGRRIIQDMKSFVFSSGACEYSYGDLLYGRRSGSTLNLIGKLIMMHCGFEYKQIIEDAINDVQIYLKNVCGNEYLLYICKNSIQQKKLSGTEQYKFERQDSEYVTYSLEIDTMPNIIVMTTYDPITKNYTKQTY